MTWKSVLKMQEFAVRKYIYIIQNLGEIWKYQLSNYAPVETEGRIDRIGSNLEKSINKKSLKTCTYPC
jgi:hypothetical protein